ncbi:MAG: fibronectin type III domain-containing protein [Marinobacter sp.]|uniref:fibronectin type III domain-containing protein n=1 Tax=Marinobacter sp. TaxID=50741 RepID=UPI002B279AF1|nr:fibronectin type III domain-containing protein [Marinobacter sp.]
MSKAWIAAFTLGLLLAGCGGGSGDSDASASASNSTSTNGSVSADPGKGSSADTGETAETESSEEPRSAVLSWAAPSTRVNGDGIAMGELDKYVIRYGQDLDNLDEEIVLEEAESYPEMSHTVENLDTGTWYFTIQVQDKQGLISEPSEPVSKTIQS